MQFFRLNEWKKHKSLAFVDRTSNLTTAASDERNSTVYVEPETLNEAFLSVGNWCSIGVGVSFYLGGNHNHKRVTTSLPVDLKTDSRSKNMLTKGDIIVGNDVWIGDNATIMSGVNIGSGAIIGAHAVVAKDVEPYSIVVGNPGKSISKRFEEEVIEKMLKFQWWNWKDHVIMSNSERIFTEDLESFFSLAEEVYENREELYKKLD
jgi:acetyltransferase-like isoleucine patch superfamily enzyme